MKDRTSGIIMRSAVVVTAFTAWLSISRLLAVWTSNNHLFFAKGPIKLKVSEACDAAYYRERLQNPSLCEPIGYEYGYGFQKPDRGMPTSSFFGELYTDEGTIIFSHVLGIVVLVVAAVVVTACYTFIATPSNPCSVGKCGCPCKCCQRRKGRYERLWQLLLCTAAVLSISIAAGFILGS